MDRRPELELADDDRDQIVVLDGVSWEQYASIARSREKRRPRMAYLDGALELVTTSLRHEVVKKLLARLVECFCDERDVWLIGAGNTTFRNKAKRAGAEPDECYWIGETSEVPDLVIEVVYTSGGIDKREIYRRLGVAEVWFWVDDELVIYRRWGEFYRRRSTSVAIRGIPLDHVVKLLRSTEQNQQPAAVRAFRESLRG